MASLAKSLLARSGNGIVSLMLDDNDIEDAGAKVYSWPLLIRFGCVWHHREQDVGVFSGPSEANAGNERPRGTQLGEESNHRCSMCSIRELSGNYG